MLSYKSISDKIWQIKENKLSLEKNVTDFINRINENKHLNAFNFVFAEEALKSSKSIEEKIRKGDHGKLAGAVIAIKDVLALKDKPLTCSSKILKNFNSIYTATAVQKLIDEDAVIIGKTNCDEFAMGSSNENSAFGNVLNPVDNSKVPGGSSGGSAVAVAADLCDVSLGTDTGGSVRQPASFCGVYGLKPTYGRISRYGLTAFASSFDTIGVFTKDVDNLAAILKVISGRDTNDATSSDKEVPNFLNELNTDKSNFTIGIPKEYFGEGLSEEIKNNIDKVIEKLKSSGFRFIEIELPTTEYNIATYYILATAEASSNLARYDGARYGFRSDRGNNLNEMYVNSRSEGFGNEVKRRIMLGTYVLSAGYYDAYYLKAQKVRRLIKNDFNNVFSKVDLIIGPTAPTTAFKIGEKMDDPLQMYLSDIYTTSANLAGIPGLSMPHGKDSNGLPIGIQFMANQFEELKLLKMAKFIDNNF